MAAGAAFTRAACATIAFAAVHSLLAARGTKERLAGAVGERNRNGLYRVFYNAQAIGTFAALALYLRRLPREEVYRVPGAPAALMRLGQLAALVWAVQAARAVGVGSIAGVDRLVGRVRGEDVPPEPEAQGPRLAGSGQVDARGPFRWSRHPLNFAPLPVLWLQPTMTTRLLGFNVLATAYLIAGSKHEEERLKRAYGSAYRAYVRHGPPFLLPGRTRPPGEGHDES